jgi:hypothetical protein
MTTLRLIRLFPVLIVSTFAIACGSGSSPTRQVPVGPTAPSPTPSGSGSGAVTLTSPVPVSPVNGDQLATLRPTLTVQNGTSSSQSGTRTYEFQVSDRTDFSLGASLTTSFLVSVNQTGVPEGDGRTSFTVPSDLQPTTRMYWRARMVQGTTNSDWSSPAMFRTKLVGYNRPNELYDPLVHSETIGQIFGSVTFISGRGAQLNTQSSYIRYQLANTITSGEFSVLVEGLAPGSPGSKFKIFSMQSGTGNLIDNPYMSNVQYRGGSDGNPDNSISFKALYGSFADNRKFEPNSANRLVRLLDPSRAYFWKWTWGSEVRLLVQEGIGGATVYNYGIGTAGTYAPSPHYAYLGANTQGSVEEGSRPGTVIRQVWISDKPRPDTLGNALD